MKLVIAVLLFFVTFCAQADVLAGRVTRIYPNSSGVSFQLSSGCKVGSNTYYYFTLTGDTAKAWYALLLSAATNKATINVAVAGACDPTQAQQVNYIYQNFDS